MADWQEAVARGDRPARTPAPKRFRVMQQGRIVLGPETLVPCIIRDLSPMGASLRLPRPTPLPERFDLEYVAPDNTKQRPVMIHRAPFGSLERFVAVLIEHTAGNFPLWLSPEQFIVLPISDKFADYAYEVKARLEAADLRGTVDARDERIGRKIRDAEIAKTPYLLVVGEKEAQDGLVSVRRHGEGDIGSMPLDSFIQSINNQVTEALG